MSFTHSPWESSLSALCSQRFALVSRKTFSIVWHSRLAHQSDHLDTALVKFTLQSGKGAKLSCADGGEVGGVGEEDSPAVADELVEIDLSMGGLGLEVRSYVNGQLRNFMQSSHPYQWIRDAVGAALGGCWRRNGERWAAPEAVRGEAWRRGRPWGGQQPGEGQ